MNPDFEKKLLTEEEEVSFQAELNHLDRSVTNSCANNVEIVDNLSRASVVLSELKNNSELVFDCEGVRLGRDGKLTLIQLGDKEGGMVYLFDVLELGKDLFPIGMKDILESREISKYMFDCKKDSESLYHEYGVKLTNVMDMQLYEFIVRQIVNKPLKEPTKPWHYRRDKVRGLGDSVNTYVNKSAIMEAGLMGFLKLKKAGDKLMNAARTLWRYRPLSKGMKSYAAMDIEMIRIISKEFHRLLPLTGITMERVKIGSEIYAGMRRDADGKPDDVYVQHPLMVSYVIPDVDDEGNILPFSYPDAQCVGCQRGFEASFVETENSVCKDCEEAVRVKKEKEENENSCILIQKP